MESRLAKLEARKDVSGGAGGNCPVCLGSSRLSLKPPPEMEERCRVCGALTVIYLPPDEVAEVLRVLEDAGVQVEDLL